MKKLLVPTFIALAAATLLSGCIGLSGGTRTVNNNATLGQQLIDLQKARDTGAITQQEFQEQKAKMLQEK